jgi:beta-phosphoglucomutase-like phosphatase (HAD superfamily)
VIEDSTNGIKAAKAAGIYCVGYISENSHLQELAEADMVVNHFKELNAERVKNLI